MNAANENVFHTARLLTLATECIVAEDLKGCQPMYMHYDVLNAAQDLEIVSGLRRGSFKV